MKADELPRLSGSGKPVENFSSFCEGDTEPTLNKRIEALIGSRKDYIVYVDSQLFVQWSTTSSYGSLPDGFKAIANQVACLETISLTQLTDRQREPFGRLLAEAMDRILGDHSEG